MTIQHIVMAGGGYLGLYHLGILTRLLKNNYLRESSIKSIYGTSIGAFFGAVFCLNEDWENTMDYFIKRPWHKVFHITPNKVFQALSKKGLFDKETFDQCLLPLLKTRNFDETMTLQDLYELSNISLYMYTIDLNTFTLIELSHESHPNMRMLDALYMTCSLPYLFQPHFYESNCYIDGGLLCSYPIKQCLERVKDSSNVLGLRFNSSRSIKNISEEHNVFEYGYFLYRTLIQNIRDTNYPEIVNEIVIPCMQMNMNDGSRVASSMEERESMIKVSNQLADRFLGTVERL